MSEPMIKTEIRGRVGLVTLNRAEVLNALSNELIDEVALVMREFDANDDVGAIVLTGSEKAFAAGADIAAMKDWSYTDVYKQDYLGHNWESLRRIRKPVIAAVSGFALGGGCELAMQCDFIIAGINPGFGGTQRLPRAMGKAKAMDMILTARMIGAHEAEKAGLVARVVPTEKVLDEAMEAAAVIASMPLPAVMMAKESINRAYESPLNEGLLFERRNFHALFATHDQKEGMNAFIEKRAARFRHE